MAYRDEDVAKVSDSRSLSDILACCGRTINPLLDQPQPSWQQQQECTQINNETAPNPDNDNRSTVNQKGTW